MKNTNALVLRIRMPIVSYDHPRNFITKLKMYEKILMIIDKYNDMGASIDRVTTRNCIASDVVEEIPIILEL